MRVKFLPIDAAGLTILPFFFWLNGVDLDCVLQFSWCWGVTLFTQELVFDAR